MRNRCENISPQQIVHSSNALLTKVYNVTIAILGNQNIIPMGFLEKKATRVTKHRQKPHRTVKWMAPEALMNQSCGCFLHTPKNPASQSPSHWQRKNGWAKQRFGSNLILTAHNIYETSFFKMLVDDSVLKAILQQLCDAMTLAAHPVEGSRSISSGGFPS